MTDKQKIEALEDKIEKLEGLLEKILSEKKTLTKIAAGPFQHEKTKWYRLESGGIAWFEESKFFKKFKGDLEIGMEVLVVNEFIVDVLPEQLFIKKEIQNTFDLIDWDHIGGLRSQIDKIRQAIEMPLKNADEAKEYGVDVIKGLLLYGPPGCGKTLIAKAIASMILKDSKANDESFVYIKGPELLHWLVGSTEARIKAIFDNARAYYKKTGKKAVVFIDEAEAILPVRGSVRSSDVDRTIVPMFLSEMDGFDEGSPIMILSTNLPENIDTAITRQGRIDLKVPIARPTKEDLVDIFKVHLTKKKFKCVANPEDLAKHGAELIYNTDAKHTRSGAMVEAMVKAAARNAFERLMANKKTKEKGIVLEDLVILD